MGHFQVFHPKIQFDLVGLNAESAVLVESWAVVTERQNTAPAELALRRGG
jgi:hypothetical protein